MAHLLIGAPHKSSGKTTITIGLCAALRARGLAVQPFKKGPDYIDPMWLGRASGRPCYNLDFNTQSADEIGDSFGRHAAGSDIAVIEGNMGLFDSLEPTGGNSNADLAVLLGAPVVLVVDVKGMTRSAAALIQGFQHFEPGLNIAGVILNNAAGERHEKRLREALALHLDIPVLGVIHREPDLAIDERHLGLVPSNEEAAADALLARIAERIGAQVDLDALLAVARQAPAVSSPEPQASAPRAERVRIGVARDAAFGFYYPDDLEALELAGAELVPFDTLRDTSLPEVDGLFIGGGFPETQAAALASNLQMREAVREAIDAGMPAYAECGGLMYLCRRICWESECHDMVGLIDADAVMRRKPVGRGYIKLRETGNSPWPEPVGTDGAFRAHEFHYSHLENLKGNPIFAYEVLRGAGIDGRHDGLVYRNLVASYAHLRDVASSRWTAQFVEFVRRCRIGTSSTARQQQEHS